MLNAKKVLLLFMCVLLGFISGFISAFHYPEYPTLMYFSDFLPGLYFGFAVCVMLMFILRIKVSKIQALIFIIGSISSYFVVLYANYNLLLSRYQPYSFLINIVWFGLLGGGGICATYKTFAFNFNRENLKLILVSIIVSPMLLVPKIFDSNKFSYLLLFILWQGAMMGCLAYFTINKIQKEIKVRENLINYNLHQ